MAEHLFTIHRERGGDRRQWAACSCGWKTESVNTRSNGDAAARDRSVLRVAYFPVHRKARSA